MEGQTISIIDGRIDMSLHLYFDKLILHFFLCDQLVKSYIENVEYHIRCTFQQIDESVIQSLVLVHICRNDSGKHLEIWKLILESLNKKKCQRRNPHTSSE